METTKIISANGTENAQTTSEVVKAIVAFDKRIETLKELTESGKKFARLENNRVINRKNVDDKKRSIKEVGVLQTITVVEAKKVVELGYKVVDFETGEEISDPESYKVIIDGQHRYTAFNELSKEATENGEVFDKELSVTTLTFENVELLKILNEINNEVRKWDGKDYINMVEMATKGKYSLLTEIDKLTKADYSLDSACKWLTFKNEITKAVLTKVVSGEKLPEKIIAKITNTKGVDRGLNILESAKKTLSETVLKTRTVIDWIISKYDNLDDRGKGTFETDMCSFFESIDKKQSETIEKAKGTRGVNTKEDIILKSLNNFYDEFLKQKQAA